MAHDGLTDQQHRFIRKYVARIGAAAAVPGDASGSEYRALADRIRDLSAQVAPVDDAVLKKRMAGRIDVAQSAMARAGQGADFSAAHRELDRVSELLEFYATERTWKRRTAALRPTVVEAVRTLVRGRHEIVALWKEAQESATLATSGTTDLGQLRRALARLDQIEALIAKG